jgi:hypothetical protein
LKERSNCARTKAKSNEIADRALRCAGSEHCGGRNTKSLDIKPPYYNRVVSEPKEGAEVGQRAMVKGKSVPVPEVVYVLVHPQSANTWWVQEFPLVQKDGNWSVNAYLGTESLGIGESFDIVALATDEGPVMRLLRDVDLAPAQQLSTTIPLLAKSNLVTVKRTR